MTNIEHAHIPPSPVPTPDTEVDISLIVPAWNEERYLPTLLETVRVAREHYCRGAQRVETIIADNGSTDGTRRIAEDHGCTVVVALERCIAVARNAGARAARGWILAFGDADYQVHPETFNHIYSVMQHPEILGGATGIECERQSFGIGATECFLRLLFAPMLSSAALDGGVRYVRRCDFETVGGFDEGVKAGENVRLFRALTKLGRKRRPVGRTAARDTARRLGAPSALAIHSNRKYEQFGEWHTVGLIARLALYRSLSKTSKWERLVQRYWYDVRR